MSSSDYSLARQLASLGEVNRLFEEKQSGAQRGGRTALADMISYAREGDIVVVSSMDRIARSVVDLNQIVGELTRGIRALDDALAIVKAVSALYDNTAVSIPKGKRQSSTGSPKDSPPADPALPHA